MIGQAEVACLGHTLAWNHCVAHDLCRRSPFFNKRLLIVHAELIKSWKSTRTWQWTMMMMMMMMDVCMAYL